MTRVLIVDDKEENLYYLDALLTAHGCVVEPARHGAEALVKARQNPPDLVVSDLLMPIMDGYTLLRHWKADPALRHIPFIVYTATYTEAEDERLALGLGADAFILKPAEPDDFLARLHAVQANSRAAAPATPRQPVGDETALLKVYSETLIRKLEEKTLQLEEANRALQRDIAERKLAEERIGEQAALLDQTQDAIIVRDLDDHIRYWNKGAEHIYGWTAAEAVGRPVGELLYRDPAQLSDAMTTLLRDGAWSGELEHLTKTRAPLAIQARWTLLRDSSGAPRSVLAVNTDVTERKKIEAQFLRAQRLESIGTLAGGIAHDLNNLLAPITMGVELLRQNDRDGSSARMIDIIERSALRGTELVKQVLSFARGIEGARVPVNLGHLVREIEGITRTTFPKNITFERDLDPGLWLVFGDPTQLNQVVLNLCVNARDAMPDGGRLVVSARNTLVDATYAAMNRELTPGRHVVLEVADEGCGMSPEIVERVFEPFFTTKDPGKGTGLGLSTVVGIVRSHGGVVEVASAPGKGSVFKIYLPARSPDGARAAADPARHSLPHGDGELILVVDDETAILEITRHTLEAFGYRAVTAADGAEAMAVFALRRGEIALVLTDMMMPVMDGPTLIAALRRLDPAVRVIATSGINAGGDEVRALRAGAVRFLAKPYTADHLLLLLHAALAAPAGRTV